MRGIEVFQSLMQMIIADTLESTMRSPEALPIFKQHLIFEPIGTPTGNLTLGKGCVNGANAMVAIVESRIASGALGVAECDKLASAFKIAATTKQPLFLWLDSAGAKVSEGLPALGAFRRMYGAALHAAASGAPITVACGTNCFGGASMTAALAGRRLYCDNTRFAMSGPAILAQSAGMASTDEMFQAMAAAAIGVETRTQISAANVHFAATHLDISAPLELVTRHRELKSRLEAAQRMPRSGPPESIRRKDLDKLYADGCEAVMAGQLITGTGTREGVRAHVVGWLGGNAMNAAEAWRLADAINNVAVSQGEELHILIDCDAHAASLDDERLLLSEYVAHLGACLHAHAARGTMVRTFVIGKLGGGIYVALTAAAKEVVMLYGSEIQLLPGKAIASILGEEGAAGFAFADYKKAGVAETELKLGLV
jgi:acetyl-CoA carboxylase carboxyltransferase component